MLQILDAVIMGCILLYFIVHALELSVFFDKMSLNSIGFVWFLLCRTLNVCDHEVTAVKK